VKHQKYDSEWQSDLHMKVRFEIQIEDMVALNQYHNSTSSTIKKSKYTRILIIFVLALGASFLIPPTARFTRLVMVQCAIVYSIVLSLIILYKYRTCSASYISRVLKEGENKGILCWREIELDSTGVTSMTDTCETRYLWKGIEKIVETDSHVFLFTSTLSALVFPKNSVPTEEADRFVALAKQFWISADPERQSDK